MANNVDFAKLLAKGNALFEKREKRARYIDQPHAILDPEETAKLSSDFDALGKEIPEITAPSTFDEVYVAELKRICRYNTDELAEALNPRIQSPVEILNKFNVTKEDIDLCKDWILENREKVLTANKNRYDFYSHEDITRVAVESPEVRHEVEVLVFEYIAIFKRILTEYFNDLPGVTATLNDYRITVDSINSRSVTNRISKLVLMSARRFCYSTNSSLKISVEEFISTFGHEFFGHARNTLLTEKSFLPYFIKQNDYRMTSANAESVAMYFGDAIFEFLNNKPEAFKLLSKDEPYENIYKRYKDTKILSDYWDKLSFIGLWVLSNSKQDDFDAQNNEILKYSIDPRWPPHFITNRRNEWNRSTGLLLPKVVSELSYSVNTVSKLISKVSASNFKKVEELILIGKWSPLGISDWVKVNLDVS